MENHSRREEDQQAGLLLVTGSPRQKSLEDDMTTYLPRFSFYEDDTNGSNMLVAWQDDVWTCLDWGTAGLCGAADERRALALTLRRVTPQEN